MEDTSLALAVQHGRAVTSWHYLFWIFLIPVLGYLLVFPLVKYPELGFDRWGGSKWAPVLDYSYHAAHADADVVVFGDSSAFLGIDPRQVDRELGVHTVVLPNTVGSLQVTGDLALRKYLAVNPPPRSIVFFFTPWDLNFLHFSHPEFLFEGEEMLIRNGSLRQIAAFARKHPRAFLEFPLQVNALLEFRDFRLAMSTDRRQEAISAQGHMDYTDPYGPVSAPCSLPAPLLLQSHQTDAILGLMNRYVTPETRVYLYLAPIPSCSNAQTLDYRQSRGVKANVPQFLPPSWFAADGMYAHILPPHVSEDTHLFVKTLRSWGIGPSTATTRTTRPSGVSS